MSQIDIQCRYDISLSSHPVTLLPAAQFTKISCQTSLDYHISNTHLIPYEFSTPSVSELSVSIHEHLKVNSLTSLIIHRPRSVIIQDRHRHRRQVNIISSSNGLSLLPDLWNQIGLCFLFLFCANRFVFSSCYSSSNSTPLSLAFNPVSFDTSFALSTFSINIVSNEHLYPSSDTQ